MTPTPRTDAEVEHAGNLALWISIGKYGMTDKNADVVPADFARQLERELAEAKARIAVLEEHVHGDAIENYCLKEDLRDAREGNPKLTDPKDSV